MKASTVVGVAALAGAAWYLYSKRAAAAAALPGTSTAPGASSSAIALPAPTLQTFTAPSLTMPTLPTLSLAPVSVGLTPFGLPSINITGPQAGPTPQSFWAGLTPAPMFSSTPFASGVAFPSGAAIPLSQLEVRIDASGNPYVLQGGQVYQLSGPSGGYYTASMVTLS